MRGQAAAAQYRYPFDALGITMGLVDANGNLSGKPQHDAFGSVPAEESLPRSAFLKYVGAYQYMPEEFGDVTLLGHRSHGAGIGMWLSGGPAGPERGSDHCRSSPVRFVDPTGPLAAVCVRAVACGVLVFVVPEGRFLRRRKCW